MIGRLWGVGGVGVEVCGGGGVGEGDTLELFILWSITPHFQCRHLGSFPFHGALVDDFFKQNKEN